MPNKKNIALIGFPGDYFHGFALSLQSVGFNIYWVCTTDSMYEGLKRRQGIKEEFLINLFHDFNPDTIDINISRFCLSNLEAPSYPKFNDIILMDRILRKKNTKMAIKTPKMLKRVAMAIVEESGNGNSRREWLWQ